jgi:hypothetical protein
MILEEASVLAEIKNLKEAYQRIRLLLVFITITLASICLGYGYSVVQSEFGVPLGTLRARRFQLVDMKGNVCSVWEPAIGGGAGLRLFSSNANPDGIWILANPTLRSFVMYDHSHFPLVDISTTNHGSSVELNNQLSKSHLLLGAFTHKPFIEATDAKGLVVPLHP